MAGQSPLGVNAGQNRCKRTKEERALSLSKISTVDLWLSIQKISNALRSCLVPLFLGTFLEVSQNKGESINNVLIIYLSDHLWKHSF